ncbi:MAG: VWA domain-containing protein [Gemmataceae bacterium]|nr:VWA domain-containing protein [Gemmataceae bacterium]
MKRLTSMLCGAALAWAALASPAVAQQAAKKADDRPSVEVVFCLDTTGSMGGLIDAAKKKIWTICNQIAAGKPTPRLRVGLVAYRDRGDEYVTKVFDLTDDLDTVHSNLMGFRATGGGDFPESVNQALHESVTKVNWSKEKRTLKIIFLVGDAPPQMNYKDDVKYQQTCKLAVTRDIIINTIQCGTHADTQKYWREICQLAEGSYVQIDQGGGPVVAVATPFDGELAKINAELASTTLPFGGEVMRKAGAKKKADVAALPAPVAAERAAFAGRTGLTAAYDLIDQIKAGKVKLESLKKDELPVELQKLTLKEQQAYLKKVEERRKELNTRAVDLDRKRSDFIAQKLKEDGRGAQARDSFDNQVLRVLQTQARRVNIQYEMPAEEKKK